MARLVVGWMFGRQVMLVVKQQQSSGSAGKVPSPLGQGKCEHQVQPHQLVSK